MKLTVTTRINRMTRFVFDCHDHLDVVVELGGGSVPLAIGADTLVAHTDRPVWIVFTQPDGGRAELHLTRAEADQLLEALVDVVTDSLGVVEGQAAGGEA